jgi:hypothetical protein
MEMSSLLHILVALPPEGSLNTNLWEGGVGCRVHLNVAAQNNPSLLRSRTMIVHCVATSYWLELESWNGHIMKTNGSRSAPCISVDSLYCGYLNIRHCMFQNNLLFRILKWLKWHLKWSECRHMVLVCVMSVSVCIYCHVIECDYRQGLDW